MRNNVRLALVRAAAEKALQDAGVREPEVPVEELVRAYGLSISEGDVPQGWGYFHPASWSIRLSAALYRENQQNRNRRRFTLAHELGHCVLEHGETSCWNLGLSAEPSNLNELDDVPDFEQEAHQFARELLLPRPWVARAWVTDPNPERWALIYGVSTQTLFIVLMERRLLMRTGKHR
jgi:Zn-dependent peptidase ImmA (M78 family)